jgi:cell volume regulation protein A
MVILGFSWRESLLCGAIVSSTDAAAVFAVMRSRGVSLKGSLKPLLELESGSNDPMAIFLTTAMIGLLIDPDTSIWGLVPRFFVQMVAGGIAGYLLGRGMVYVINRLHLEYDGLYPVLSMALVLLIYGITTLIGGNGFLAVYLAGLVMGNTSVIHQRSLMRFHDSLAWLMQIAMFLTLGLLYSLRIETYVFDWLAGQKQSSSGKLAGLSGEYQTRESQPCEKSNSLRNRSNS